ncbi:MAG: hypothetical protein KKE31_04875 [Planctomycetes bacterium]|nr:hypothetical protein [Planctomycetota bacterium]MBU1518947.1 hypothetical protein [Planctomycetota bacterium]MBU2457940.1 hypothetical protein [Planctomycetota bacterium]
MLTKNTTRKRGVLGRLFGSVAGKPEFHWYPSNRGIIGESNPNSSKTAQIPPLMVRKAAWRK